MEHETVDCTCVAYKTQLDAGICAEIVRHTVTQLLYLRGQIPCVFDQLMHWQQVHDHPQDRPR
jgi:hypothetical protein